MSETNHAPLTKQEIDKLFSNFRAKWEDVYLRSLTCGALDESYHEASNHRAAKFALLIAAEGFSPLTTDGRKDLRNLRHFV